MAESNIDIPSPFIADLPTATPTAVAPPLTRVIPTSENPRGYPPFDIGLIPSYTNRQLRHYHIAGAMLGMDRDRFRALMQERTENMELLHWDGNTRENSLNPPSVATSYLPLSNSRPLLFDADDEADSDCPPAIPNCKGIQVKPSDLPHLSYNSNVAQYTNWLAVLKKVFAVDAAKYPSGSHKIFMAILTLDEQINTTYNSAVQAHPALATHWRKFQRWVKDLVLHGDSDMLKLADDFTYARQRVGEDPNQFYIRLFNLGIQSGRTIDIADYRTRLLKPLKNLVIQHNEDYPSVRDLVTYATRLWQTLDHERMRQDIKDKAARRDQPNSQSRPPKHGSGQQPNPQQSREPNAPNGRRLSAEERQFRIDNNRCHNCGYPSHRSRNCNHRFNPNHVTPRAPDDASKAQRSPSQKPPQPFARAQPVQAGTAAADDDTDPAYTESEGEPDPKRQKN